MDKNGDLDCWYATDDEGNDYHAVHYSPSLYYRNIDSEEVYDSLNEAEDCKEDGEEIFPICIVN